MADLNIQSSSEETNGTERKSIIIDTSTHSLNPDYIQEDEEPHMGHWAKFKDSFKPMPGLDEIDPNLSEIERANLISSRAPLKRSLKNRHIQMIAIGSAIGTGLFIGSGAALATGGPASLVICYSLIGIMIFCTIQALGELAVAFPVSGSYLMYNTRFISPVWGFTMAWNVALLWSILLPLELVASSMTIKYWDSETNSVAWVSIFYVLIALINIFGVRGYGEAEFTFSLIKVTAVVGFIILGIVLNCGGGPDHYYIGGKYWHDPGAFRGGFKGLCSVFVTAAFSFGGTELVGMTAAEAENPRKALPTAIKQVVYRIVLFYLVSLTVIGVLVPYNHDQLLGTSSVDITASPFVIAIHRAGIKVLPDIMNAVILIAVLSVANSAVYGCSRTISSLGNQGFAPKWFAYIDKKGRPMVGIIISLTIGCLCFLSASDKQSEVFSWLMALSGLSSIFTWFSICLCHLRFRRALQVRQRSTDELAFTAILGVYGSYFGCFFNVFIFVLQFWTSLFPVGKKPHPKTFFSADLSFVVIICTYVCYSIYEIYKGNYILFIRAKNIDIDTGKRCPDVELLRQEVEEEKQRLAAKPFWYRAYKFWC
ncbi:unnamed protein product [Ambrosiozyma monospora]|uniref:Unnamed protein product n=1 Tax=Ambrosiozyma monospora TaxID=43982 RepID=A0A9W7DE13_AMBMO|nr:unnamed protein product [Ambrosiozyma monospora]